MQCTISNLTQVEFNEMMLAAKANSAAEELSLLKMLIADFLTDNTLGMTKESLLKVVG